MHEPPLKLVGLQKLRDSKTGFRWQQTEFV